MSTVRARDIDNDANDRVHNGGKLSTPSAGNESCCEGEPTVQAQPTTNRPWPPERLSARAGSRDLINKMIKAASSRTPQDCRKGTDATLDSVLAQIYVDLGAVAEDASSAALQPSSSAGYMLVQRQFMTRRNNFPYNALSGQSSTLFLVHSARVCQTRYSAATKGRKSCCGQTYVPPLPQRIGDGPQDIYTGCLRTVHC